jgi:hypothetical protein
MGPLQGKLWQELVLLLTILGGVGKGLRRKYVLNLNVFLQTNIRIK